MPELTTTAVDTPDLANDLVYFNDVSETPDALNQAVLWKFSNRKGSDIASAGTVNLDTSAGDCADVTGTTTITAITLSEGREFTVRFTGILTLTNGASLVLPGGTNITTAAGDFAVFRGYAAGVVRCVAYQRSGALPNDVPATATEMFAATNTTKPLTPNTFGAFWKQGGNIASAGTITIGDGKYFHVTGTTTITDIDFTDDNAGREVWLIFDGILILTHNASTLILPGGANITTAAGDAFCFVSEGADAVRCVAYQRAASVYAPLNGYLIYDAVISQTGTSAPTATVGQNTMGGTMTWARSGVGTYTLTCSVAAFTANKTQIFIGPPLGETSTITIISAVRTSTTVITVRTQQTSADAGGLADIDAVLTEKAIRIVVFP